MDIIEWLYCNKKSEDKYNTLCFWKVKIRTTEINQVLLLSKVCTFL